MRTRRRSSYVRSNPDRYRVARERFVKFLMKQGFERDAARAAYLSAKDLDIELDQITNPNDLFDAMASAIEYEMPPKAERYAAAFALDMSKSLVFIKVGKSKIVTVRHDFVDIMKDMLETTDAVYVLLAANGGLSYRKLIREKAINDFILRDGSVELYRCYSPLIFPRSNLSAREMYNIVKRIKPLFDLVKDGYVGGVFSILKNGEQSIYLYDPQAFQYKSSEIRFNIDTGVFRVYRGEDFLGETKSPEDAAYAFMTAVDMKYEESAYQRFGEALKNLAKKI